MKHLKNFNETISKRDVVDFLMNYTLYAVSERESRREYIESAVSINNDGSVKIDSASTLTFSNFPGKELPFKFDITGALYFAECGIENFNNFPDKSIHITISNCKSLTTLEGGPKSLQTLEFRASKYAPTNLYNTGGWFPPNLGVVLYENFSENRMRATFHNDDVLKPHLYQDHRSLFLENLPIPFMNILKLFCLKTNGVTNFFESVKDYDYIRGNQIIKPLFKQACREYGLIMPTKIDSYTWLQ